MKIFEDEKLYAYAMYTSPSISQDFFHNNGISNRSRSNSSGSEADPRERKKQRLSSPTESPAAAEVNSTIDTSRSYSKGYPSRRVLDIVKSMYAEDINGTDKAHFSKKRLPSISPDRSILSFLLVRRETRGKFLPEVARSLGITEGTLFGKLSNGKSVTAPSGRVVHPHECLGPSEQKQVCKHPLTFLI